MKVMFIAFAAAIAISFAAPPVLNSFGWSSQEKGTTADYVRLD